MELLIQFGFFLFLLVVGLLFGSMNEKRHFRQLKEQEAALREVMVFNERHLPEWLEVRQAKLVVGSVVIGEDYFKRVAAALKSIFGGRLTMYESLMDRGRREAVLRMKQEARRMGATMIFNVRFETASLSEDSAGRQQAFSAEFIAYGTALVPAAPPA
ncbi:MAG TPA: heavy metal-binding domain-containing protein [Solimonas sp.]|nr:heavy metal-binding domain-containing protein [Solimonas sp.]